VNVPVLASNDGVVLYAADLGIYGNCAILDHGMGVQSLYAHLSSFDVKVGDQVKKGQPLGRRHHRPRRRHLCIFDARQRPPGERGRVVGSALIEDRIVRKTRGGGKVE
jgi:hypothetical protein